MPLEINEIIKQLIHILGNDIYTPYKVEISFKKCVLTIIYSYVSYFDGFLEENVII